VSQVHITLKTIPQSCKFRIEVFDDDGKAGPGAEDESIGVGYFSISKLEHAHKTKTSLPITDKRWGKSAGQIVVRSFRMNGGGPDNGSGKAYPPQKVSGGGYPLTAGTYSQPQTGYPPQSGYPPHAGTPMFTLLKPGIHQMHPAFHTHHSLFPVVDLEGFQPCKNHPAH
jgi:hypothetical protein